MPKILKQSKQAIQSRERQRLFRGIKSIMSSDDPQVNFTTKVNQFFNDNGTSNKRLPLTHQASLSNKLRTWAIDKKINKRAVTALLEILRSAGFEFLPKDSRTLLETPRTVKIVNLAGGKYWHNGLTHCLTQVFSKLSSNLCVQLNVSIDGLPLFKSSPVTFWPILANVYGNKNLKFNFSLIFKTLQCSKILYEFKGFPEIQPMAIGIWCGNGKPSNLNEYLRAFCNDIDTITKSSIMINGYHLDVKIRVFLCDSPARSFLKGFYFIVFYIYHTNFHICINMFLHPYKHAYGYYY